MHTIIKHFGLYVFLFSISILSLQAQHRFGMMPQVNTDFKIGRLLKVNAKLENRFILYQNPLPTHAQRAEYERTDVELIVTANNGLLKNAGMGYLIRRSDDDGSFLHRSIQQYSFGQQISNLQLAHRLRTDQTFEKQEATQYRLRYRLSLEKPLSGLKVDPKEYYLKFNTELIGILKEQETNMELRLLSSLGYNLSEENQLEMGLDYRAENLIGHQTENLLWLAIGWYHSF